MPNPEVEPIIIAQNKDGVIEIWDGFHRLGIAIKNTLETVPVLYGYINAKNKSKRDVTIYETKTGL